MSTGPLRGGGIIFTWLNPAVFITLVQKSTLKLDYYSILEHDINFKPIILKGLCAVMEPHNNNYFV